MQRSDFYYELPEELIAVQPLESRSDSRLLCLDPVTATTRDSGFRDLPGMLDEGDLLVFNNTRVIPARLFGHKQTGGRVELLIERITGTASAQAPLANAVPARVVGVFNTSGGQVIVLEAVGRNLYLPIWVADREAQVAQGYLQGQRPPRPLTHDLLLNAITSLGGRITQVLVSDLRGRTFIGRIDLIQGGIARQLDSRSSDAVCVGLGARVPLYIMIHVLAQAGMTRPQLIQQGIILP